MPRVPRGDSTHNVYHVISRGVDRRAVFNDDSDRRAFLVMLREAFSRWGIALFSYCLMGNHFHMLLSVSRIPLGVPMHHLLTRYSLYFNHKNARVGHLFQSRYGALQCHNLGYLIQLAAYIHLNPVRAGLVASPTDWPWSSHAEFMTGAGSLLDLDKLEDTTGMKEEELREQYAHRVGVGDSACPKDSLVEILRYAALRFGLDPDYMTSGKRGVAVTRAKKLAVELARAAGYSMAELAIALKCSPSGLSHMIIRH